MNLCVIWILIVVGMSLVEGKPVRATVVPQEGNGTFTFPTLDTRPCRANAYCNGYHLPLIHGSSLRGKQIQCDIVDNIDNNCCLAIGYHYVCYNITIDGEYLSMDQENILISTEFSKICEDLLPLYNKTAAAYTMIIVEAGEGTLAYRYGEWEVVSGSTDHIKHLACQFEHSFNDPPEIDAYITAAPSTEKPMVTTEENNGEAKYTVGKEEKKDKKVQIIKKDKNQTL